MFGYIKTSIGLIMLKQDAYDEVIGDEDAFLPSVIVLLLPMLLLGVLLALVIGGMEVGPVEPGQEAAYNIIVVGKALGFSLPFFLPLMLLVFFSLGIILYHLIAKLLKGDGGFLDLFQVLALPSYLIYIPFVGLWYLVVLVVGIRNVYGLSTGKAVVVWLIAYIINTVVSLVLFGIIGGMIAAMAG